MKPADIRAVLDLPDIEESIQGLLGAGVAIRKEPEQLGLEPGLGAAVRGPKIVVEPGCRPYGQPVIHSPSHEAQTVQCS